MFLEILSFLLAKITFFAGSIIGGGSFPKPLDKDEETECLIKMSQGDKSAKEKLINHNLRLVAHVVKKYTGSAETDDLISVGSIGLIKAINTYQVGKGTSLATYTARCIENEILMLLRANKKHKICVSIEEPIGVDKDGQEMSLYDILPQNQELDPDFIVERKVMMEEIAKIMKSHLNNREYQIICLRYGLLDKIERTQQEVADMLKISRSYISRIETKAIEIIRQEFLIKK